MKSSYLTNTIETALPVTEELIFLKQQTGQDEATILIKALHLGLSALYRQTVEQLFIDGELPREKALGMLGEDRLTEIEYAKHAIEQDVKQGFAL